MSKKHLTTLYVVRKDGTKGSYPSNYNTNRSKGITKLKNILKNAELGRWEIAYLYDAQSPEGTAPLCAFHPSMGTTELSKQEAELLRAKQKTNQQRWKYRGYCVPTLMQQLQGAKPYTIYILDTLEARQELDNNGLYQVIIYNKANTIINRMVA